MCVESLSNLWQAVAVSAPREKHFVSRYKFYRFNFSVSALIQYSKPRCAVHRVFKFWKHYFDELELEQERETNLTLSWIENK